ncbi:MAG: helix-turn-helix domain-containing protein [Propionibacteriaceae bacterium]|nr:helix-turn-helix domain-containing protein [Actinomycetota bacterium]MCB0912263.1 helix-turn-helix domain-containing protein [Propionibacteriaceae bacterium]
MTVSYEPAGNFDDFAGSTYASSPGHVHTNVASLGEDALLTTAEVALMLRTPGATLRTWRYQDIGPRWFHLGPRGVRYKRSDVLAWLDRQYDGSR